jgi:N-acetylneuraminic acid mutarotase
MTWTQPVKKAEGQVEAPAPSARAGHTSVLIGSQILVFGGGDGTKILNDTWTYDWRECTWSRPNISGTPPAPRCAHTATLLGEKLIIFGGGDGSRRFKDLYILDTGADTQKKIEIHKENIEIFLVFLFLFFLSNSMQNN